MTVAFVAQDLRGEKWAARIVGAAVAFLVLWIGEAMAMNQVTRHG